jgi:hypothetical protein
MIEWKNVQSPSVNRIGYDRQGSCMYIDFNDSRPFYTFTGVTEDLYQEFITAWESEHPSTPSPACAH